MRWVSTRVLPEPAPAMTSSGPSSCDDGLALDRVQPVEQVGRHGRRTASPSPYRRPPTGLAEPPAARGRLHRSGPDRMPIADRREPASTPSRPASHTRHLATKSRSSGRVAPRHLPAGLQLPRPAPAWRRPTRPSTCSASVNPCSWCSPWASRSGRSSPTRSSRGSPCRWSRAGRRLTLFRIQLSTKAVTNLVPGGSAAGGTLGYRLLTEAGVTPPPPASRSPRSVSARPSS